MKRKILFVSLAIVVLFSIAFLLFGWWRLDHYLPEKDLTFAAPFRTMAEHNAFMQDKNWPYILQLDTDQSALLYYGSWHTTNPDDPQIAEMRELWQAFQPTVAVTENRSGLFIGTEAMGIGMFAEFGLVYSLAHKNDVPIYTLEPTWEVEVAEMKAAFPTQDVTLFYTLRVFLNERGSVSPEQVDDLAAELLQKRGNRPGLQGSLPDLPALEQWWQTHYAELGDWRKLPVEAIHPSDQPTRLQQLAVLANQVRDRHAARVILDLLQKNERVFAVAGGSHVVKQEPVIRAGMGLTLSEK